MRKSISNKSVRSITNKISIHISKKHKKKHIMSQINKSLIAYPHCSILGLVHANLDAKHKSYIKNDEIDKRNSSKHVDKGFRNSTHDIIYQEFEQLVGNSIICHPYASIFWKKLQAPTCH